jgi:hypothetical protein
MAGVFTSEDVLAFEKDWAIAAVPIPSTPPEQREYTLDARQQDFDFYNK